MEIAIVVLLILLNGFFALSEIALVSSRKNRLHDLCKKGSYGAKIALQLLENSEQFLSAIQVGITLIGIVLGAYSGTNIAKDITPFLSQIPVLGSFAGELAITVTIILITYISIVIGELVPKTIAMSNPEKLAVGVAPIIHAFSLVFYPFVKLLSVSTNLINSILRIRKPEDSLTKTELRQLMKHASLSGVIHTNQYAIHEKIFNFEGKKAKHLMTHRTDVEIIDLDDSDVINQRKLKSMKHNRIICCRGDIDRIEGVLDLSEYYQALLENQNNPIEKHLIEPVFVVETLDAERIIYLFRSQKTQFCVVLNEYGGFEGVISLHDIIEGIIGDIPDEGEIDSEEYIYQDDDSVIVNGDASVEILEKIIEGITFNFEEIDYSTVAGFVLEHLNDIPKIGDNFTFIQHRFEVICLDENRIEKVRIKLVKQSEEV